MRYRDRIEDVPVAEWDKLLNVMLRAAFVASKAVFPVMRGQGGGLIVHTASRAAWNPLPWGLPYASAKTGLLSLSRSLAALGAPAGIRSNAICPGPIRSGLQKGAPHSLISRLDAEGWVAPKDVARVVRYFVAHPDVTGAEVLVEIRDGSSPVSFLSRLRSFRYGCPECRGKSPKREEARSWLTMCSAL
jgi:3-oxoacyl-[acyl-carrier protein] reductase